MVVSISHACVLQVQRWSQDKITTGLRQEQTLRAGVPRIPSLSHVNPFCSFLKERQLVRESQAMTVVT